jgi:hypothetical protein
VWRGCKPLLDQGYVGIEHRRPTGDWFASHIAPPMFEFLSKYGSPGIQERLGKLLNKD